METHDKGKVLIVDDERQVLKAVEAVLLVEEHQVCACSSAEQALKAFREEEFDAVLSDVRMPEMDGVELLAKLREINPEVPVILHTGYAELESAIEAVKSDAFDYLVKPVEPEVLVRAVGKAVAFHKYNLLDKEYRKRLESDVEKAKSELMKLVAELKEARDDALEASRLKSEFIANVSHELRTPLNNIVGMTELLLDEETRAAAREYLQMIEQNALNLDELFRNIMELSILDSGKAQVQEKYFNLSELLIQTKDRYQLKALNKGIEMGISIDPKVPDWMVGDKGRLEQLLDLLLDNAIKFTDTGSVCLSVSHRNEEKKEDEHDLPLLFVVSDTGCGISADKFNIIFDAFRQGDGSLTRRHGGTGLGLAIARRVAELLGGEIEVASEAGKGAEFRFTVRFRRQ